MYLIQETNSFNDNGVFSEFGDFNHVIRENKYPLNSKKLQSTKIFHNLEFLLRLKIARHKFSSFIENSLYFSSC